MKKIIFLFFIITGFSFSQSFQAGFRSESTWFNTTEKNTDFIPIYHFFITASMTEENIFMLKDLSEEIRFGRIIEPGYLRGNDIAFALKSHIIKKLFYLTGGLDIHYNSGGNQGVSAVYVKNFDLLLFGIGINPDRHFFIELSKYIPISNAVIGNDADPKSKYSLNSFIALSFGINIDL